MRKYNLGKPYNQGMIKLYHAEQGEFDIVDYVFNIPRPLSRKIVRSCRGGAVTNALYSIVQYAENSSYIEIGNSLRGRISVATAQNSLKYPNGEFADAGIIGMWVPDLISIVHLKSIGIHENSFSVYKLAHLFNDREWHLETNFPYHHTA